MISSTDSSRKFLQALLSVALGSTALLSPLCAHAGFELTPARTVPASASGRTESPPSSGSVTPLPMYEGLKSVDSAPLSAPVVTNKPVRLDMKPLEKKPVSAPPVSVMPTGNLVASPIVAAPEKRYLASDEMLPLPPAPGKVSMEKSSLSVASVKPVEIQKVAPPPNVPVQPSLTGAIVPAVQNFTTVEGFGREVPLALAMRQIVPPDYAFSFGEGADPGKRVSWTGGAPWNEVLQKAVEASGLKVSVDGKTVVVAAGKGTSFAPPPAMAPPPAPLQPEPASSLKTAMMPPPRMAGKEPGAPVSLAPVSAPARVAPFMKSSGPAQPVVIEGKKGVDTESLLPPSSVEGDAVAPVVKKADSAPPSAVFAPPVPIVQEKKPASLATSPRTFNAEAVREWTANSGSTLRKILSEWSREAGVQLYWSSEYDYPVQADVMLNGTYEKAVATLLDGLRDAQPRPLGRLHPNPPDGPAVLIIETRHIIN